MNDRIKVKEQVTSVYFEYLTLEQVRTQISDLIEEYGADAFIGMECSDPYSDSDKETMYVYVQRLENDKEYEKRMKEEARRRDMIEDRDRKEFERLQAKYKS